MKDYFSTGANKYIHACRQLFPVLLILLLASCGSDNPGTTVKAGELKACELLSETVVASLVNEAVLKSQTDIQKASGAAALSQCTYTFENHKRLTFMVRRSGENTTPSSKAEQAEKERTSDPSGGDSFEKLAAAIEAGDMVDGLGDLAFTFQLSGSHLWAYWDQHYALTLWLTRVEDAESALKILREAAQSVIGQL